MKRPFEKSFPIKLQLVLFFFIIQQNVCVFVCVCVCTCVCDDYMYVSQNVLVVGLQRNNFLIVLFVSF